MSKKNNNKINDNANEIIDNVNYKNTRTRNWAFIMYPDSVPVDYNHGISIISDYFIPFAVSPLHDRDCNADGEPKKPHWHVLLTSDGVKSYSQIKEIAESVNGSDVRPIGSAGGYYRYFTHKDNPEKAQYNELDIKHYMNFNAELYNKPSSLMRYYTIRDMMRYIKDNQVCEYYEFLDFCREYHFDDWFKLLCDNSSFIISEYIKSLRNYKYQNLSKNDNIVKQKNKQLEFNKNVFVQGSNDNLPNLSDI